MSSYDPNQVRTLELLLNQYIAVREEDLEASEVLRGVVLSHGRTRTLTDSSGQNDETQTASNDEYQRIARDLRNISLEFEKNRSEENKRFPEKASVSEVLNLLGGEISVTEIARGLNNSLSLTPDELEKALDYIRRNSDSHFQMSLILDFMVALKLFNGASATWPWIKDWCFKFVLRNDDTRDKVVQISKQSK